MERRAVEGTAQASTPDAEYRQTVYEPGRAVIRLLREYAEQFATILEQTKSVEIAEAMTGFNTTPGMTGPNHVDTYA
ncbi:MAG: hypothetical protein KKB50_01725 [Planctomycetes bacterium]|nr:hypothetical protein [Planctomycetota bacterium]